MINVWFSTWAKGDETEINIRGCEGETYVVEISRPVSGYLSWCCSVEQLRDLYTQIGELGELLEDKEKPAADTAGQED